MFAYATCPTCGQPGAAEVRVGKGWRGAGALPPGVLATHADCDLGALCAALDIAAKQGDRAVLAFRVHSDTEVPCLT